MNNPINIKDSVVMNKGIITRELDAAKYKVPGVGALHIQYVDLHVMSFIDITIEQAEQYAAKLIALYNGENEIRSAVFFPNPIVFPIKERE